MPNGTYGWCERGQFLAPIRFFLWPTDSANRASQKLALLRIFGTRPAAAFTSLAARDLQGQGFEKGLKFAIREGGRTVGAGVVTEIIE